MIAISLFLFVYLIKTIELEEKLHSAEEKCQLLEKQLKYMKDIRQSSDVDHPIRFYPYEQRHYRQPPSIQPPQVLNGYASPQIEKLAELERGQIKLTASQTLAEVGGLSFLFISLR